MKHQQEQFFLSPAKVGSIATTALTARKVSKKEGINRKDAIRFAILGRSKASLKKL